MIFAFNNFLLFKWYWCKASLRMYYFQMRVTLPCGMWRRDFLQNVSVMKNSSPVTKWCFLKSWLFPAAHLLSKDVWMVLKLLQCDNQREQPASTSWCFDFLINQSPDSSHSLSEATYLFKVHHFCPPVFILASCQGSHWF